MILQVNVPAIHPELLAATRSAAGTSGALWKIGGGASVLTSAATTSAAGISAANGGIGWQPA